MYSQLSEIVHFIFDSFLHIWPYLLITIPIAVAVRMSGVNSVVAIVLIQFSIGLGLLRCDTNKPVHQFMARSP